MDRPVIPRSRKAKPHSVEWPFSFSFEHRGHFVPGQGDIVVIEWPGIKAGEPTEDFPRDGLFLRTRQRIKSGDHAFGDCAHCNKFSGQPSTCHLEPVEAFEPRLHSLSMPGREYLVFYNPFTEYTAYPRGAAHA